jgi:hypothetical protein
MAGDDSSALLVAGAAALFTAAQAFFQYRQTDDARKLADYDSTLRKREKYEDDVRRQRDADAVQDAAYLQVWSEHFRIDSIASQWDGADLVALSLAGLLNPAVVLPESAASVASSAARLSRESGFLAVTASTFAGDTARLIAQFNTVIEESKLRVGRVMGASQAESVRAHGGQATTDLEVGGSSTATFAADRSPVRFEAHGPGYSA